MAASAPQARSASAPEAAPDALLAPRAESSIPAAFLEEAPGLATAETEAIDQAIRDSFAEDVKSPRQDQGGSPDLSPASNVPEGTSTALRPRPGYPSDPWERAARLADEEYRGLYGDSAFDRRNERR